LTFFDCFYFFAQPSLPIDMESLPSAFGRPLRRYSSQLAFHFFVFPPFFRIALLRFPLSLLTRASHWSFLLFHITSLGIALFIFFLTFRPPFFLQEHRSLFVRLPTQPALFNVFSLAPDALHRERRPRSGNRFFSSLSVCLCPFHIRSSFCFLGALGKVNRFYFFFFLLPTSRLNDRPRPPFSWVALPALCRASRQPFFLALLLTCGSPIAS